MAQVRVRKRGKTFSYIFEAGKVDGKRKVVEKGGFPTKAAAYKAGVEAYNDFIHGNIGITSESVTLKVFLLAWLENVVAKNVKPTTLQTYKSVVNVRILPHLGEMILQSLTPAKLDSWIRKLAEIGFSHSSLKVAYAILSELLDYAVYPAQLINSNPAAYIKIPKNAPKNIVKRVIISNESLAELLKENPPGTNFYIPIVLLFCTGVRIGELLALTWTGVNFEKKIISVREQIIYVSKRGYFFAPPKSSSSTRDISIGDELIKILKRWRTTQKENEINCGKSYVHVYHAANSAVICQSVGAGELNLQRTELICTQNNGQPLNRRSFMRLLKSKGLNAHSFRHTHATILAENGASLKGMAYRLGHSKINVTQDFYVHNTQRLQDGIADIFEGKMQTSN